MTWAEKTIVKILLLVAKLLADINGSPELAAELRHLSNHVSLAPTRADK